MIEFTQQTTTFEYSQTLTSCLFIDHEFSVERRQEDLSKYDSQGACLKHIDIIRELLSLPKSREILVSSDKTEKHLNTIKSISQDIFSIFKFIITKISAIKQKLYRTDTENTCY